MTTEQQSVLASIAQLRKQYASANEAERKRILETIEELKKQHKLIKCKECKRVMFNDITEEHWPFCGETCHTIWADKNYGSKDSKKGQKTIEETKAQINRMKKEAILKKHQKQQSLL